MLLINEPVRGCVHTYWPVSVAKPIRPRPFEQSVCPGVKDVRRPSSHSSGNNNSGGIGNPGGSDGNTACKYHGRKQKPA